MSRPFSGISVKPCGQDGVSFVHQEREAFHLPSLQMPKSLRTLPLLCDELRRLMPDHTGIVQLRDSQGFGGDILNLRHDFHHHGYAVWFCTAPIKFLEMLHLRRERGEGGRERDESESATVKVLVHRRDGVCTL